MMKQSHVSNHFLSSKIFPPLACIEEVSGAIKQATTKKALDPDVIPPEFYETSSENINSQIASHVEPKQLIQEFRNVKGIVTPTITTDEYPSYQGREESCPYHSQTIAELP
jgi:hypothetical protein